MGAKAGRLLRGVTYHSVCQYYLVSQNLSEREVLHVSPCYRVSEPPLRGYISDTDLLSGAGELPFAVHGCVAWRGCGAAHGSDSVGKNPAFEDDFTEDDDEEIVTNKKKKKKNFTKIELNQVKKIEGPIFSEEDDGADDATKIKKEEKKPQSFLSRYWYIIAIMMVMMMMNGGGQEPQPGQGQQGQGQGQQAGGAGNTNPGN